MSKTRALRSTGWTYSISPLSALDTADKLVEDEETHKVEFPRVLNKGSLIPEDYEYIVVNAKVKKKFSFVAAITKNVALLHLYCEFKYEDRRNYSDEFKCTMAVPPIEAKPS